MRNYLFCIVLLLGGWQSAAQAEVFERTLANGLKVIVKEDHRAPVIVQQIWYRAGAKTPLPATISSLQGRGMRPAFHPSYVSSNLIFRISCSTFVGFISPSLGNMTTGQITCYKTGQIKSSQQMMTWMLTLVLKLDIIRLRRCPITFMLVQNNNKGTLIKSVRTEIVEG